MKPPYRTFLLVAILAPVLLTAIHAGAQTLEPSAAAVARDCPACNVFGLERERVDDQVDRFRLPGLGCSSCFGVGFEREHITEDIYHYSLEIQVGPSDLDRMRVHRVVREPVPYHPIRTSDALFIAHGINFGFQGTFMPNLGPEGLDPTHNLPVYLAQRDVDVWAIDFRWILVSPETPDISELADWGLEQDAADLGIGLGIARWGRWLTGSGFGRINLLGYSRGGRISYVYLNDESQLPRWRRHVDRVIQVDVAFKTDDEDVRLASCELIDEVQAQIDGGNVADDIRFLALAGELALAAPDDPSPIITGLTNRQVALVIGTLPPGGAGTFHIYAGEFEQGFPVGLRFTAEAAATQQLASAAAYQPLAGFRDILIIRCDDGRSGLDDHLGDITAPILYIGAGGGNGDGGLATFPHLGSTELESFVVAFEPPGRELFDVGHGDILNMDVADNLVWQPIFEWVTTP